MKSLLHRLFIQNWPRKLISCILAMIIWIIVHHSMTATKILSDLSVRVIHLSPGKTIEGMQVNGLLKKRISLTVIGMKEALDELTSNDFEVVIDAKDKTGEWIATIDKKNLIGLKPNLDVSKIISKVIPTEMIIRHSKLVTEKIPITITQPIGEMPRGYQFVDIWPYQLSVTVNGPEETVKQLKTRGLKLTFNLNDISKDQLDEIRASNSRSDIDEFSFFVPEPWKKITIAA